MKGTDGITPVASRVDRTLAKINRPNIVAAIGGFSLVHMASESTISPSYPLKLLTYQLKTAAHLVDI